MSLFGSNYTDRDRVLALAGLLQATDGVRELAERGDTSEDQLGTAVTSLFTFQAPDVPSIFGGAEELRKGLRLVAGLMQQDLEPDTLRYAFNVLHLARRLRKDGDLMTEIRERLKVAEPEDAANLDDPLFESLGGVYRATLSPRRPQVVVTGDPGHLQRPQTAARIRTLLLGAFRAAVLWYQTGGSAWRLILHRGRYADTAQALLRG